MDLRHGLGKLGECLVHGQGPAIGEASREDMLLEEWYPQSLGPNHASSENVTKSKSDCQPNRS